MFNWDNWQTLLAVYRTGSYSQAAKSLHIDATTVGRRIKALEKQLNYRLFIRNDGQLFPSHRCIKLLTHIETASEALRLVEQESARADSGIVWRNLRLAAPPFVIQELVTKNLQSFTQSKQLRIEIIAKIKNDSISKREVDIALSIDDMLSSKILKIEQIESELIGDVHYAVYANETSVSDNLPWAGLNEGTIRTTGSKMMTKLAGKQGFQYRSHTFNSLGDIAAQGIAKVMLPSIVAEKYATLKPISETVLVQPLRMLYHHQDRKVHYLKDTRDWLKSIV